MTIEQINNRIEELKAQKSLVQGRETEVYARIVGYYRSVKNWNKGKKEEYGIRVNYSDFRSPAKDSLPPRREPTLSLVEAQRELSFSEPGETSTYLYFYRETCPNCPPVAAWLKKSGYEGRSINVDRESGMLEAKKYEITAAPTVVFLDAQGNETGRGSSVAHLESLENQFSIAEEALA